MEIKTKKDLNKLKKTLFASSKEFFFMNDGKIERELEQQISFVIGSFKNLFKCIEVSQAVLLLTIKKAESKEKKKQKR